MVGLFLPLAPGIEADTEVSLNFFYDNLSPYGSWIDVAGYGYCFQPSVAVDSVDWRPYADGYWAYTDVGWTWVSYEDFGWATYHYGRWTDLADYGWVWVPGYEWGPAWVSWRTGGDYIGWAPLPPVSNVIYEGRAITGQVDVLFDIGPLYYNFCDVRYIGEPVLRGRIFAPSRNVTIINQTINVTNITYHNSTVYNYGPSYNRLNQYSARPIQRLTLQRETTGNFGQGGKRGNFNRVNGNQLTVVAPTIQKSQGQIAPKQVKAKVEKPKVEHGWQGVENRKQLQDEMKKENAKNVRPPSFQPQKGRKRETDAASQNAGAAPNEAANAARQTQLERGNLTPAPGQPAGTSTRPGQPSPTASPARSPLDPRAQSLSDLPAKLQFRESPPGPTRAAPVAPEASQRAENARRAEQAQETLRAQRAEQAAQEAQRAKRAEQVQQLQQAERARRAQEALRAKQVPQPEPAQHPQPTRQPVQVPAQPPQGNQNPNAEHQGKKKKPVAEQTPGP